MRLLIECTYIYDHPYANSGIQRVVRNIIREGCQQRSDIECIPIIFKKGHAYEVLNLAPRRWGGVLIFFRKYLEAIRNKYWLRYNQIETHPLLATSSARKKIAKFFARLCSLPFLLPFATVVLLSRLLVDPKRARRIEYTQQDVLLLLDSSWHADVFIMADRLKAEGLRVISVIYDLIPITHPQFCDAGLVKVFQNWFDWIARTADGFMSISATISAQVQQQIVARGTIDSKPWFDYFYLGADLDLTGISGAIRDELTAMYSGDAHTYLMVSTIEPRKNHAYLLDAFDLLWGGDTNARLCFVGRVGWKCAALMQRIKSHPELGKRLFVFNDLSDAELEYCYEHSSALVFPSFVEGFGLPLVEAMQRGLPAMASNIPVFREIGGDYMAYFDLDRPASLTTLVDTFERTGLFPAPRPLAEWHWLDWREAANTLVQKILLHTSMEKNENNNSIYRHASHS